MKRALDLGLYVFTLLFTVAMLIAAAGVAEAADKTFSCGPAAGVRDADVRTWIATPSTTRVEAFDVGTHFCALRVRALVAGVSRITDLATD